MCTSSFTSYALQNFRLRESLQIFCNIHHRVYNFFKNFSTILNEEKRLQMNNSNFPCTLWINIELGDGRLNLVMEDGTWYEMLCMVCV